MRQRRIEPVMVFVTDNQLFGARKEIAELALSRQLPSMHSFPDEVEDDGLISTDPWVEQSVRPPLRIPPRPVLSKFIPQQIISGG